MEKRSDVVNIKVGDRLSETQYYEVMGIGAGAIKVRNERGFEFDVSNGIVEEGMYSADQHTDEVKLNRTEMVAVLEGAGDTIFTANFHKQASPKDVATRLKDLGGKTTQKALKEAMLGTERTLVGYLLRVEPKMGRSQVIDLEVEKKGDGENRIRQIDHRTLNWIVIKGVKYSLK